MLFAGAAVSEATASSSTESSSEAERSYRERFFEEFPPVETPPSLDEYVSVERFDRLFLEPGWCAEPDSITNEDGSLAWTQASHMMAFNEMFRATGDPRYLAANLRCARATLEVRDDARGKTVFQKGVAPVWGSSKYVQGRRIAHALHTARIVHPILDCVGLVRSEAPHLLAPAALDSLVESAQASLNFHDFSWRDGPGEDEGYYREDDVRDPNPQPANGLSAIGTALWLSWKVSGNERHRDRALAVARYMKRRMEQRPDGTYFWPHILPRVRPPDGRYSGGVGPEDTSHGGACLDLPVILASESIVFDSSDVERLAQTALSGFARATDGVLYARVDGKPSGNPYFVGNVAPWLQLVPGRPELYDRLAGFYRRHVPQPKPLDLALLLRYHPARIDATEGGSDARTETERAP